MNREKYNNSLKLISYGAYERYLLYKPISAWTIQSSSAELHVFYTCFSDKINILMDFRGRGTRICAISLHFKIYYVNYNEKKICLNLSFPRQPLDLLQYYIYINFFVYNRQL